MVWAVSLSTMKLIPHCLTATLLYAAIWSLIEFGNLVGPLAHSELYLRHKTRDAAPKCISRRTSYLRVRLAFHPYPQLIPRLFNADVVRASTEFYSRFTLAMGRSPGFGSTPCNYSPS